MRKVALVEFALVIAIGFACACSGSSSNKAPNVDAGSINPDAGADAGVDAGVDKSARCATSFGQAIGSVGFARFDGTVVAVVPPNDQACTEPNMTHLVVQIMAEGAVYRMVVDVSDTSASGTIRTDTLQHALIGGAWSDGWHSVNLDYVTDLGLSSSAFTTGATADAVTATTAALGAKVSIFATAQGEADSAHLIHRNLTNQDGAIVIDPDGASPTWLLFAFSDQSF
jgi:hypothetical protein